MVFTFGCNLFLGIVLLGILFIAYDGYKESQWLKKTLSKVTNQAEITAIRIEVKKRHEASWHHQAMNYIK